MDRLNTFICHITSVVGAICVKSEEHWLGWGGRHYNWSRFLFMASFVNCSDGSFRSYGNCSGRSDGASSLTLVHQKLLIRACWTLKIIYLFFYDFEISSVDGIVECQYLSSKVILSFKISFQENHYKQDKNLLEITKISMSENCSLLLTLYVCILPQRLQWTVI